VIPVKKKANHLPEWIHTPPGEKSYRSIFKWGAPDVFKHPNKRLYRFLKEKLALSDADFRQKKNLGGGRVSLEIPTRLSEKQIERLADIVGRENVSASDYDRVKFGFGKSAEEVFQLRNSHIECVPDAVVHPRGRDDVRKIVALCHDEKLPIYACGGGSSVTLGVTAVKGGIALAMGTHMNRVIAFNETNQTITVETGIMGPDYEKALNRAPERFKAKRRYTGGHFPQSFEFSSVGGWIAALGSGQESSYYGDMADIVLGQEIVTPTGSITTLAYPGTATGPRVNDILKGSEGAFGVTVSATLKVFRHLPNNSRRFAFIFPDWNSTIAAAREISQGEFGLPSVFRISDPEETGVALTLYGIEGSLIDRLITMRGFRAGERCLFIGKADGEKEFVRNVAKRAKRICRSHGAMTLGGYPVKKWEEGRYGDSYLREDLNDAGIVIDTLETGVPWDRIHRVHEGVRQYIKKRSRTILMSHASHFYPQGTNLYFIFITPFSGLNDYRAFQRGIIRRIQDLGGSLSHHHGIGKMMAPFMEAHLGRVQMDVLRALKGHFDPHGIMNPGGTLGLD